MYPEWCTEQGARSDHIMQLETHLIERRGNIIDIGQWGANLKKVACLEFIICLD